MSREAMQMALGALESDPISHAGLVSRKQAITALRQALETEQEPVAYASDVEFDDETEIIPAEQKGKLGTAGLRIPLYIDPPASKPWVGLVWGELPEDGHNHDFLRGAAWAEAKLREKNKW